MNALKIAAVTITTVITCLTAVVTILNAISEGATAITELKKLSDNSGTNEQKT